MCIFNPTVLLYTFKWMSEGQIQPLNIHLSDFFFTEYEVLFAHQVAAINIV